MPIGNPDHYVYQLIKAAYAHFCSQSFLRPELFGLELDQLMDPFHVDSL